MEPLSSSSCSVKRKINSFTSQENTKRLKTEVEDNALTENEHLRHPPRISVLSSHYQEPVTLEELTELLHFSALGKAGNVHKPSWCRLHQQRRVKGVNVVVLEGLTQSDFYKHFLTMRHLRTNYSTRLSFTPSGDIVSGIISSNVSRWEKSSLCQEQEISQLHRALKLNPIITRFGKETRGLTAYTVAQEEMIKYHFPVKGMPGFEDFACTDSNACVTDSSPLYGLDCEMCLTEKGLELTRVSLVDSTGKCLLDELVKPLNPILNYLTQFSGINRAMLRPITTTLRDAQTKLKMLLPRDAVLVGHSIENDLRALKIIHSHVIDTSLLYRRETGSKYRLKVLAEAVLKKEIQSETKQGHDPTEDATAALELAQYFIEKGPQQVAELHFKELWGEIPLKPMSTLCVPRPTDSTRFADVLHTSGQSVVYIGKRNDITLELSNQQWLSSDSEVLAAYRRDTKCPSFSVLQFSSFSDYLKTSCPHQEHRCQRAREHLRDMCVVLAGPFPSGFSDRDVKRLFGCCGAVVKIRMLNSMYRVHAEIEFVLLEGAELALKTLNGLNVQRQHVKVQRPCHASVLDMDLTLDALVKDHLNVCLLYAVRLKSHANHMHISPNINGHLNHSKYLDATRLNRTSCSHRATVNGSTVCNYCSEPCVAIDEGVNAAKQLHTFTAARLSEEELRETFGCFGTVDEIDLPAKPCGKRARHARIKFQSSEEVQTALRSSEELWKQNYLICPSLTPSHMRSWVTASPGTCMYSDEAIKDSGLNLKHDTYWDREMDQVIRKLDSRLGKLFKSLPDYTLSVVVMPGSISSTSFHPGMCFIEVKNGTS